MTVSTMQFFRNDFNRGSLIQQEKLRSPIGGSGRLDESPKQFAGDGSERTPTHGGRPPKVDPDRQWSREKSIRQAWGDDYDAYRRWTG